MNTSIGATNPLSRRRSSVAFTSRGVIPILPVICECDFFQECPSTTSIQPRRVDYRDASHPLLEAPFSPLNDGVSLRKMIIGGENYERSIIRLRSETS